MAFGWIPTWPQIRSLMPLLVAFAALVFLIAGTLEGILSRWLKFDESYSHGLLLLAISIFLTYRVVSHNRLKLCFSPLWLIPFSLALIGYGLGEVLRVQALREIAVVPLILGLLAIFLGWKQVRLFIIPVGILFLAIPVWDYLAWTLQLITVEVNRLLLGLYDIQFEVDGVFVYLIGVGAFEVAHGCSGLRYLLVGQSLALIYGELNFNQLKSRVVIFAIAVFLALAANWIRVFVIFYMAHETNMQTGLIEDHEGFGWWVFAATLVPLFFIGSRMERGSEKPVPASAAALPELPRTSQKLWLAGFSSAVLPLLIYAALPSGSGQIRPIPEKLSFEFTAQQYSSLFVTRLNDWRPEIRNPDFLYQQALVDKNDLDQKLFLGVYAYEFQRHRAELIQYANRIYPKDQWIADDFFRVPSPTKENFQGITIRSLDKGNLIHLAYGYYVSGQWVVDEWEAKLLQVATLFDGRKDASLVVVGVSCDTDCDPSRELQSFLSDNLISIEDHLDRQFNH